MDDGMTILEDHFEALSKAGPWPLEAYDFLQRGLGETADRVHAHATMYDQDRHVAGQELCMGLKIYALEQYGMLAPVVLRKWNINRTDDFGRIVFAMIEAESAFQFLGLFGVALEAMLGQNGPNFLFVESDLLGLEGLPVGDQGEPKS